MMYYELHITMEKVTDIPALRLLLSSHMWHHSCIHGDADMGDRRLHYGTRAVNGDCMLEEVKGILNGMASLLTTVGFRVVRRKIEMVVYDERTDSQ